MEEMNQFEEFYGIRKKGVKKKPINPCKGVKWRCEDEPLWRIFFNSWIDKEKKLESEDKFDRRQAAELTRLPDLESAQEIHPPFQCLPFNTFNLEARAQLPDPLNREKIRIWRNMKAGPEANTSNFSKIATTSDETWSATWPCIDYDLAGELEEVDRLKKRKRRSLLPCQDDPEESEAAKLSRDFAQRRELGHARIPKVCLSVKKILTSVDQASGEHPGLVDGDYIVVELASAENKHVYTQGCLRGTRGMHLIELSSTRAREKTHKFCFYQALVALLAKTQLRYKYASSTNIDYIYSHAWFLFLHTGSIKIQPKLHLDDVVVYNYKYSVELQLISELKDVPRVSDVSWTYLGEDFRAMRQLKRPELMKTSGEIGWEKVQQPQEAPVHPKTTLIEDWFDELPDNYQNCIIRTSRFALAFWKDVKFWYMYNPYRCDRFGLWDDSGAACIMKFCSKTSLKRHLIILLLRAYVYTSKSTKNDDFPPKNLITLQIFQVIYHCVKIHNLRLLQRKPAEKRTQAVWKDYDKCSFDPFSLQKGSPELNDINADELARFPMAEQPNWVKNFEITWKKSVGHGKSVKISGEKARWHEYTVEEKGKIFSLWAELHPTSEIFARENRGQQIFACYVVCAGMTRIVAPEYWSSRTLDTIVLCGDRFYTLSQLQGQAVASENDATHCEIDAEGRLGHYFEIGEMLFEVNIVDTVLDGRLYGENSLWQCLKKFFTKFSFGILSCENVSLGIFTFCGSYYMIDVHTIGPPIFDYGDGTAYLLRTTSFSKFVLTVVLTIGSIECSSFVIHAVDIVKIVEVDVPRDFAGPRKEKIVRLVCPEKVKKPDKIICKSEYDEN